MLKQLQATPKVVRYLISGVAATAVDYLVYEVLALTILGTDLLWLASIISGIVSTFAAFFLHSHLTWIDRDPGKFGVVKFFIWNIAAMITLRPAVIALFSAVGHWNSYFSAMIYLNDRDKFPLQIILREILIMNKVDLSMVMDPEMQIALAHTADVLKYSLIVVATAPILVVYPFVQKYFVKGVMIGSIKG